MGFRSAAAATGPSWDASIERVRLHADLSILAKLAAHLAASRAAEPLAAAWAPLREGPQQRPYYWGFSPGLAARTTLM